MSFFNSKQFVSFRSPAHFAHTQLQLLVAALYTEISRRLSNYNQNKNMITSRFLGKVFSLLRISWKLLYPQRLAVIAKANATKEKCQHRLFSQVVKVDSSRSYHYTISLLSVCCFDLRFQYQG